MNTHKYCHNLQSKLSLQSVWGKNTYVMCGKYQGAYSFIYTYIYISIYYIYNYIFVICREADQWVELQSN